MEQLELAISEIKAALPGLELHENEPMAAHCSFKIGGPARALAVPQDVTGLTRRISTASSAMRRWPRLMSSSAVSLFPMPLSPVSSRPSP